MQCHRSTFPNTWAQTRCNLDFNLGKTKVLAKGTTSQHVFDRAQFFFQNKPNLQEITRDFTLDVFTVEVIEVLGWPLGNDIHIKHNA